MGIFLLLLQTRKSFIVSQWFLRHRFEWGKNVIHAKWLLLGIKTSQKNFAPHFKTAQSPRLNYHLMKLKPAKKKINLAPGYLSDKKHFFFDFRRLLQLPLRPLTLQRNVWALSSVLVSQLRFNSRPLEIRFDPWFVPGKSPSKTEKVNNDALHLLDLKT